MRATAGPRLCLAYREGCVLDVAILGAFIPASLVIILSPGADTFLLLRFAITGGRRAGFSAMAGILVGLTLVTLLLISGVGLVVSRFPVALDILTALGIGVLLLLAAISVRAALQLARVPVDSPSTKPPSQPRGTLRSPFRMSMVTNITNPKVLVFYLAFFPQFLGTATNVPGQLALLGAAFLVVTTIWLTPLVLIASAARAFFEKRKVAIIMEWSVAAVFVMLAIALVAAV